MSIFKENCLAYLKAGYSVTPGRGKKPLIKEWSKYCERLPTLEEVQEWCNFPEANIDICLGEASGIIALDFDSIDPELIKQIEYLLPDSPVERRGSKGWVRFYQYSGEPTQVLSTTNSEGKKEVVLELLSTGKKVTIAPSIHPLGMPYVWTKKPLLEVNKKDLPKMPPMLFAHLSSKIKILESNVFSSVQKTESGRNSELSKLCSQLIAEQIDVDTAVQRLMDHDKEQNEVPLFSDISENRTSIPFINASKFYVSHLESINLKREREHLHPELPVRSLIQMLGPASEIKKVVALPMPKASGTLGMIQEYIMERSFVEQPVFAMSSSLVFLATLVSRKLTFQNVTPNIYALNIADSGSGKDICQQSIKTLLAAANARHLIGAATYPSEASILVNLATQPSRIDIIDEASSFLKSASSGGAAYQTGIGDLLCELYSCSNDHYLGKILASDGGKRVGECQRPHLNILCSTTYKGLSEAINHSTLEKGLFARFLTFFGENDKPAKRIKKAVGIPSDLIDSLQHWVKFENPLANGNITNNHPAFAVDITVEADRELDDCFRSFDNMRLGTGSSGILRPVAARLYQQMLKLILLSAVSNTKVGTLPKVQVNDVKFGYALTMYFYENVSKFIKDSLYENTRVRSLKKILGFIKEAGPEGITSGELVKLCLTMSQSDRKEILIDLKESNQISVEKGTTDMIFKAREH
jgi:hypothetical protein